uniref:Uncharacterized protein n=1 Tax=Strigamia maritima TaxID=126957 RepID=T1INL1_STRMM
MAFIKKSYSNSIHWGEQYPPPGQYPLPGLNVPVTKQPRHGQQGAPIKRINIYREYSFAALYFTVCYFSYKTNK